MPRRSAPRILAHQIGARTSSMRSCTWWWLRGRWAHWGAAGGLIAGLSGVANVARAQVPLGAILREHPRFAERLFSPRLNAGKAARFIVPEANARASGSKLRVSKDFAVVTRQQQLNYANVVWTPSKRLLMDKVYSWVELEDFRNQLPAALPEAQAVGMGQGVTIGVVDGGIDLRHPDLRNADGTTRAAWLLDFSSAPLGYHAELEEEYGCIDNDTPCAILSATEINQVLLGETTAIPLQRDRLGHGTHVASIAAGGGLTDPKYQGIAPQATLIVALLAVDSIEVQDADVVLASRFVYERAAEAEQPAVVNLSLGGDFGPHDGTTTLERALVSLLDAPGRAMVVAAGNSGGTFSDGPGGGVEGPFGVHTDVRVAGESVVELVIPNEQTTFEGDVLVWVDTRPGQTVSIGVESEGNVVVSPVAKGQSAEGSVDRWDGLVTNEVPLDEDLVDLQGGTLVFLSGKFKQDEVIRLRLSGQAHAALWVQGSGDFGAVGLTRGPLFGLARHGGTITVPAAAPELIAVGATLNRSTWPSRSGGTSDLSLFSEELDDTLGSVGFFSSLGPNQAGNAKPDVLAPGAVVVAAMAPAADPAPPGGPNNPSSLFGNSVLCDSDPLCAVVDSNHGVAIGTSMAAPVVSGAVALLLEQNPKLTQAELLHLLRAGVSRQTPSKTTPSEEKVLPPAPGALNLPRTHAAGALSQAASDRDVPAAAQSWLAFADSYASPGETMEALIWTRTEENMPADVAAADLDVKLTNGKLTQDIARLAPGFFKLVLSADSDAALGGGETLKLRVRYGGAPLTEASLPIAGDIRDVRGVERLSPQLRREESCAVSTPRDGHRSGWWTLGLLTAALVLRRTAKR